MSRTYTWAAAVAVPLFALRVRAVALTDFSPVLENVPDPCGSVYSADIFGCSRSDFSGADSVCSATCTVGLFALQAQIGLACGDFDAPKDSLIALFKKGQGVDTLCRRSLQMDTTTSAARATAIGQSTLILPSSTDPGTTSLMFDTHSAPAPIVPVPVTTSSSQRPSPATASTTSTSTSSTSSIPVETSPSSQLDVSSTTTPSTTFSSTTFRTSTTTTSSAAAVQSQKGGGNDSDDDGSDGEHGGGDPFSDSSQFSAACSIRWQLKGVIAASLLLFSLHLCYI